MTGPFKHKCSSQYKMRELLDPGCPACMLTNPQYLESLATAYEVKAHANRGDVILNDEYSVIACAIRLALSALPPSHSETP
jgi:hypothetical protein